MQHFVFVSMNCLKLLKHLKMLLSWLAPSLNSFSFSSCESYLFFVSSGFLITISLLSPHLWSLSSQLHPFVHKSQRPDSNTTFYEAQLPPWQQHNPTVLSSLKNNSRLHCMFLTFPSLCATCHLLASKSKCTIKSNCMFSSLSCDQIFLSFKIH